MIFFPVECEAALLASGHSGFISSHNSPAASTVWAAQSLLFPTEKEPPKEAWVPAKVDKPN